MMYATDTILKLKKQKKPEKNDKGEMVEFPYNRVRVLGMSPVSHTGGASDWSGASATGVIIAPITSYSGNLDEPYGKLQALYDVESEPSLEVFKPAPVRMIEAYTAAAGKSPEEVFAEQAPGPAPKPGQIRARTPMSPLEDPRKPVTQSGPLDYTDDDGS
jgi:hypothetical protein